MDFVGGLGQIKKDIADNVFPNQYTFEATLLKLIQAAHDDHLSLTAGILAAFTFASPYSFVSLSTDGIQLPKVYIADDIDSYTSRLPASAIKTINGRDAIEWLTDFAAANTFGKLEPHTDWNDLMGSWAGYIQDSYSVLENGIQFFPGDTITLGFENGTVLEPEPWVAYYNSPGPTGPLATGGDFYNFFVLGLYPASFDPNSPDPCLTSTSSSDSSGSDTISDDAPKATSWPDSAYPDKADIFQPDLYPDGGGFLTGYFLKDISTGVLSIPALPEDETDIQTFSDTIQKFLDASHDAGMKRILVDLQRNDGGPSLLAVDAYNHFFPDANIFLGTRLRAHPQADVIGNTLTQYFDENEVKDSDDYAFLAATVFVATARINPETNENFTSWGEYFGPHPYNGDLFTTVHRVNTSSSIYDHAALGIDVYGSPQRPAASPAYYKPEDITLLTDGHCSSSCAQFVERMHHLTGVKAVTVGGLPKNGPMQIASGTRGQQRISDALLDTYIADTKSINDTTTFLLPESVTDVYVSDLEVNLRDQIRNETQDTPTQFLYDAADCRIFYTVETWSDYSALWRYAIRAIDNPTTLCVPGSTGFATTLPSNTEPTSPPTHDKPAYNIATQAQQFTAPLAGLELGKAVPAAQGGKNRMAAQACNNHGQDCPSGVCNFKKDEGTHDFHGIKKAFKSGTCPTTKGSMGKLGLKTGFAEPGEIGEGVGKGALAVTGWGG